VLVEGFKLYEVYRKTEHGNLIVLQVKSKNTGQKLSKNFVWERRKDLTGVHFRVVTTPAYPYVVGETEVRITRIQMTLL
jgi:hypothetical protein